MKPVRLWHQSVNELNDDLDIYRRRLVEHAKDVLGTDAGVDVQGLPPGTYGGLSATGALGNAFIYHRPLDRVLSNAVDAERKGYDGFVIGSFSEPLLREIRSAVDFPVAGLVEASLLVGCSLGKVIAPISNAGAVAWMTRTAVEKHGLGARVMEVQAIDPPLEEPALAAAYERPEPVVSAFQRAAERAVARGADVIIPAEGVLAELLYGAGVRSIAGATVIDVFGALWAYELMLIRLWQAGTRVGRAWHYRRDDPALVQTIHDRSRLG
jgi:Asp/Glu/hydantoin racemase